MPKLSTDTFRIEKHLRTILGLIALVAVPPMLILLVVAKSPGVTDIAALEHAQLARHIANGDGFVTSAVRPLSLALSPISKPLPDLVNAPLHPLLLAGAFSLGGASEKVVMILGVGLWLWSVWLVFWIARYWWDWRAAGLAAVFYVVSMGGLAAAAGGMPQVLMALLVLGAVALVFPKPERVKEGDFELALWQPALSGVLCGAATLTDYRLLPLALVLGVYLARTQQRKAGVIGLFVGTLFLTLAPWGFRNWIQCGSFTGLYWYAALENTRQFPGESIWRMMEAPEHPFLYLLMHPWDLVRKVAQGLSQYRAAGLGLLEPFALFLGAVAVFGAPAKSSRRRLAWIAASSAAVTILFSCLTKPDARLLLAWTPILSCVAAAQLVAWVQSNVDSFSTAKARLRLSTLGMRSLTYAAVIALMAFPVVMYFGRAYTPEKQDLSPIASAINKRLPSDGVLLTDTPAFTAWHLDRPSLLLCQRESDLLELEKRTGKLAGIYLSPAINELPPREQGDWWMWITSPRGVYRGLGMVSDNPLPGLLRLARNKPIPPTEQEWLETIGKSVQDNPQSAEARAQLAFGYMTLGRLREAEQEFREANRLDEYNVEALIGLWQTMAQMSHADGTLRLSQLTGQISPNDPRAKPLLEQAAAHFEQVAAQRPGDPWVLLNLAVCRARLGQWKETEVIYARLGQLLPKAFPPRLMLANLYFQQGELEKASEECETLLQENASMPTAHHLAGRIWLAQNKLENALKEFVATVKLRPQWASAHAMAGQVCLRLKQYDQAIQHLDAAIKLAPRQINLQLTLADVYVSQGNTTGAISLYSGILAADCKQPVALNNLAELLTKTGKAAEALPLTRQAVKLYPQNPLIRDTAGWVAFNAGNPTDAVLHLREAVRLAPKQGISHYHLAKVLLAQQRREEARESLRLAIECGLTDVEKQDAEKTLAGS
jgi:tetratricopeptide (TPR) repeat protein